MKDTNRTGINANVKNHIKSSNFLVFDLNMFNFGEKYCELFFKSC